MSDHDRSVDVDVVLDDVARALAADVRRGLCAERKWLPPRWFYDERGSELFDAITRLAEYYPTEAERQILAARADDIVAGVDTIVELGSGTSDKTTTLLDAAAQAQLTRFVAFDVSEQTLRDAVKVLADQYPTIRFEGVVGDFEEHLELLPSGAELGRRMVVFLGGTIGNLAPPERGAFLSAVAGQLAPGDELLVGVDLVKDPARLLRAYDDASGVTADFNRNVLHVVNRVLGADFCVESFAHRAIWNAADEWIEMHLVATESMSVTIPGAELTVAFDTGESIRTEISAKFRRRGFMRELSAAGFDTTSWWTDAAGDFAVAVATHR